MNVTERVKHSMDPVTKASFLRERLDLALSTWDEAFYNNTTIKVPIPAPLMPYAKGYLYPQGYKFNVTEQGVEILPRWVGAPRAATPLETPDFYLWLHTNSAGTPVAVEGPDHCESYITHQPSWEMLGFNQGCLVYVEGLSVDRPKPERVSYHSRNTVKWGFKVDYRGVKP